MLKTLPVANDFQNIRCGSVFYLDQRTYHVACMVCNEKILYQIFPKHFRTEHLEKGYDINLLDLSENKIEINTIDLAIVKHEEKDPIASEEDNVRAAKLLDKIKRLDQEIEEEEFVCKAKKPNTDNNCIFVEEKSQTAGLDLKVQVPRLQETALSDNDLDIVNDNDNYKDWEDHSGVSTDLTLSDDDTESSKEFLPFECTECKCRFATDRQLANHKRSHGRPKQNKKNTRSKDYQFKCDQCDKAFLYEKELESHKYKHTGIFCDICGLKFSQLGNMRRHKLRHTGVKGYKCDECGKEFYTVKELDCHKVWHTRQFRYICEICAKPCVHKANLKQHMRRHTGERPYKCEHCGKCFFTQHDLNVHSVAHSDARPFVCDICGSTFRLKKALRVHKKIHIKERPFVCEICNKGFILETGLKAHMRCHDGTLTKIAQITAPKKKQPTESTSPIDQILDLGVKNWEDNVDIDNVV